MYIRKLAMILATLVMLVMASPAAMAAESGSTWDQVKAAGSDLWGTVKEKAPGAWETTKNKASELYDKAIEKAPEVKEKVKTGVNNAQEKISDYREGEEKEFWQWFENQTGGMTNATPSTHDHADPNINPGYEPNPDQKPEYEPGPDSTTGGTPTGNNAQQSAPSARRPAGDPKEEPEATPKPNGACGPDDVPRETLDQYAQGGIFYYNPDDNESRPASEEVPEAIVLNGKVYQYATGAPVQGSEYEELVVDGRTYRRYLDEDIQTTHEASSTDGNQNEVNWGMLRIIAIMIGVSLLVMGVIFGLSWFHAREAEIRRSLKDQSDTDDK